MFATVQKMENKVFYRLSFKENNLTKKDYSTSKQEKRTCIGF